MHLALVQKIKSEKMVKELLQISIAVFCVKSDLIYVRNARIIHKSFFVSPFPADHFKINNQSEEPNRFILFLT